MTRQRTVLHNNCPHCNRPLYCRECGEPVRFETGFHRWLREQGGALSSEVTTATDIDFVVRNYRDHWIITLELKHDGNHLEIAQRLTQFILAKMLYQGGETMVCEGRRMVSYTYRGHYTIILDKDQSASPEDCNIDINGSRVSFDQLKQLLMTGTL